MTSHTSGTERNGARILLVDTNRWSLSARLAIELAAEGCAVGAVCPAYGHALLKTRAVERTFRYSALDPASSLRNAIKLFRPHLIVPACDRSVRHLHDLYLISRTEGPSGEALASLIVRSLGHPDSFAVVSSRYELLRTAAEQGVLTPDLCRIGSKRDLDEWHSNHKPPYVLKANGTWGGVGVRIVKNGQDLDGAWGDLTRISGMPRAIKRMVVNHDSFPFWSVWKPTDQGIIAQSFVDGVPANCTVFASAGVVRALIAVEVVQSEGATGPASVVRRVDNPEITMAAEKLSQRLGLTGFFGLDFVIEKGTGAAYLIEMNPRLTPPCYLRLGEGRDLVGAVMADLNGAPQASAPAVTNLNLLSYGSPILSQFADAEQIYSYHVPSSEPELAAEMLNPFPDRTFLFRFVQRLGSRSRSVSGDLTVTHVASSQVPAMPRNSSEPASSLSVQKERLRSL